MNEAEVKKAVEILSQKFIVETDGEDKYSSSEILDAIDKIKKLGEAWLGRKMPEKIKCMCHNSTIPMSLIMCIDHDKCYGYNEAINQMRLSSIVSEQEIFNVIDNTQVKVIVDGFVEYGFITPEQSEILAHAIAEHVNQQKGE